MEHLPPLFSVIITSTSDYQSRFFCSADASPDRPSTEEEKHVTSVIRCFQQTTNARTHCGTYNSQDMSTIIGSVHCKWFASLQDLASRTSPCLKYRRHPQPVLTVESNNRIPHHGILSVLRSQDVNFVLERCHISRSREYLLSRFPFSICLRKDSESHAPVDAF
jgi:hypothetical protein